MGRPSQLRPSPIRSTTGVTRMARSFPTPSAIRSVTATGPSTVVVDCKTSDGDLPIVFSRYIGAGDIISPAGLAAQRRLRTRPSAPGLICLARAKLSLAVRIRTYPNPYFYDQSAVHWDKVVVKVISNDNAALSALQTGQVQVAGRERQHCRWCRLVARPFYGACPVRRSLPREPHPRLAPGERVGPTSPQLRR